MTEEYRDAILRLRDWIRRSSYKTGDFAREIGMTEYTISWVIHEREKRQYFTAEQAAAVERVTGGEFRANELLPHVVPDGYKLVPLSEVPPDTQQAEP